jgi:hypothetical protein
MAQGQDGNGSSDGKASGESGLGEALAGLFDGAGEGDDLGALLMGQLDAVIESWGRVVEVVAQHGVDPTPLLQTLARTLRATADQLDPDGRQDP